MKKIKNKRIKPEEAIAFLDSFQKTLAGLDKKTQPISIRIPANLLEQLKFKAAHENRKYQSMIVEAIRDYVLKQDR